MLATERSGSYIGGFLGIGGSSAKTDRKTTLSGYGDLNNTFNVGLDTGKSTTTTGARDTASGVSALGTGLDYFKKLVSGDRQEVASAVAPETNTAIAQQDALRNQRGINATARGGGGAAETQTAQDKTLADIDNFLFGVRPQAGKEVANIGSQIAGVGTTEQGIGLGFTGLAEKSAQDLTGDSIGSRTDSYGINKGTQQDIFHAIFG